MKSWLIIAALVSIMGGVAWFYYDSTQTKIETLTKNNAILEGNVQTIKDANDQTLKTIDILQEDFVLVQENYSKLEREFQEIRSQRNILSEKFEGSDLGKLASARPETIERIINNASDKSLRCLEILTGSPLTDDERNATSANEFNSECPFLWNTVP